MSFSTLANYYLTINRFIDRSQGSTIPDSSLADLVTLSENKVTKHLRVAEMESALAATAATAGTCAVPSDYLELKFAYMDTSPVRKLQRRKAEWIYEKYPNRTSSGTESFVAKDGSSFIFGEPSTLGTVMKGRYYAKPTAMSSTINSVFSAYPEVYLFAALSECEPFIGRDPRIQLWESKYQQAVANANGQEKDESVSGSDLTAQVG